MIQPIDWGNVQTTRKLLKLIAVAVLAFVAFIPLTHALDSAIVGFSPSNGAENVSPSSNIKITFSSAPEKGAGYITLMQVAGGSDSMHINVTSGNVSISGNDAVISPPHDFVAGAEYAISMDTGAFIVNGNPVDGWGGTSTWSFTARPADVHLNDLVLDGATISGFSSSVTSYTEYVAGSKSSVDLTAVPSDASATVSGTGIKTLNYGDNPFVVTVTATSGASKSYDINVHRGSNNADLSDLSADAVTIEGFSPAVTIYNITKASDISSVDIGAVVSDTNATATGMGTKALSTGLNSFDVLVTAEDKTTQKTYTLNITRDSSLSTNANLKDLTLDGTTVSAFEAGTTSYSQNVPAGTTSVEIQGSCADSGATIAGTGTKPVSVGNNPFDIVVTAADTVTQKIYTLSIVVPATPKPTPTPTPTPSPKPTAKPTATPTPKPTSSPSPTPSPTPTPTPTPAPTPQLRVTSFYPANNATVVAVNTSISFTLNRPAICGTGSILILEEDTNIIHTAISSNSVRVNVVGNKVTLSGLDPLKGGTPYKIVISGGAFADAANPTVGSEGASWKFTTTGERPEESSAAVLSGVPAPNMSFTLTILLYDEYNNPVPGVKVQLQSTPVRIVSNSRGCAVFGGIDLGAHKLSLVGWDGQVQRVYDLNAIFGDSSSIYASYIENGTYNINFTTSRLNIPLKLTLTKKQVAALTNDSPFGFLGNSKTEFKEGQIELTLPENPVIKNATSEYAEISIENGKLIIDYDSDMLFSFGMDSLVVELQLDDDTMLRETVQLAPQGFHPVSWFSTLTRWQKDLILGMVLALVLMLLMIIYFIVVLSDKETQESEVVYELPGSKE